MIGLHHIISLFIYSLISFFNRKNNPHFHPSSYVGTLTSFLTSSSALELAFPSDAERCFFTPTTYHRCLKYLTKASCSTISLSAPNPETYLNFSRYCLSIAERISSRYSVLYGGRASPCYETSAYHQAKPAAGNSASIPSHRHFPRGHASDNTDSHHSCCIPQ